MRQRLTWVKWTTWGFLVLACAPTVTVSRDDGTEAGGTSGQGQVSPEGGSGAVDESGGSSGTGGTTDTGGSSGTTETGGSTGSSGPLGSGGKADLGDAGRGTGGTDLGISGSFSSGGVPELTTGGMGNFSSGGMIGGGGMGPPGPSCPCSRRPAAPLDVACPRGEDASITDTVPSAGAKNLILEGTRSTRDMPFELHLSAGSPSETTDITLRETTVPPPDGYFDWSPLYAIEPTDVEFPTGGAIAIPWRNSPSLSPGGVLAIYWAEAQTGPFEKLSDSSSIEDFVEATVVRGGYFFVGFPKDEGDTCP